MNVPKKKKEFLLVFLNKLTFCAYLNIPVMCAHIVCKIAELQCNNFSCVVHHFILIRIILQYFINKSHAETSAQLYSNF